MCARPKSSVFFPPSEQWKTDCQIRPKQPSSRSQAGASRPVPRARNAERLSTTSSAWRSPAQRAAELAPRASAARGGGRSPPRPPKMTPDPPYLIFNWLVLLCIDSYDSEQRRILQHFSRSTRFAFFSRPYFSKFCKFSTIYFPKFRQILLKNAFFGPEI